MIPLHLPGHASEGGKFLLKAQRCHNVRRREVENENADAGQTEREREGQRERGGKENTSEIAKRDLCQIANYRLT